MGISPGPANRCPQWLFGCSLVALAVTGGLLGPGASPASAGHIGGSNRYWVQGKTADWEGGVSGTTKVVNVYVEPHTSGKPLSHKVGAMVIQYDGNNYCEVGWVKYDNTSYYQSFTAWEVDGAASKKHQYNVAVDNYYNFNVRAYGSEDWYFKMESYQLDPPPDFQPGPTFRTGRPKGNAEVNYTESNNWGRFLSLKYWDIPTSSWKNWGSQGTYMDTDNDLSGPLAGEGKRYDRVKISLTEYYSRIP